MTEEAKGKQAGRAAVTSVILLFVIYAVAVLAVQGIAPNSDMQANAGNILAFVGGVIGGGFWKNVMIVAVLGATMASLQATLISTIGQALSDMLSTAGTAVWYYRRQVSSSAANSLLGGVLPGLGAAFMAFVVIYSLATGSLNGIEEFRGLGLALLGLVLSFISSRVGRARFYCDPSVSHGDTVEAELAEAGAGPADEGA